MTESALLRAQYAFFDTIVTRWNDNDPYGHVNNAVYYQWFDSVINRWLISQGLLNVAESAQVFLVAETHCRYYHSFSYPEQVDVGVRIDKIGNSSIRYELALFRHQQPLLCAEGWFVHVQVDRLSQKPAALSAPVRQVLATLQMPT